MLSCGKQAMAADLNPGAGQSQSMRLVPPAASNTYTWTQH
jgi:hypothetical protein